MARNSQILSNDKPGSERQKGLNRFSRKIIITGIITTLAILLLSVLAIQAAPLIVTVDSTGNVGTWASLALDSSGNPVISYYDYTNEDVKLAVCGDSTCSAGNTITTVVDNGVEGDSQVSLRLNSSGNPVILYNNGIALVLVVCNDATCTTSTSTGIVYAIGLYIYHSMILNSSGNPVISFNSNDNLRVTVCGNPTCTSRTTRTVDDTADVGYFTSLALDSSGNPVISYYDTTNGDLKLAVCGNPTCTANSRVTMVVDSAGNVGLYSSLRLDASDHPLIAYYNAGANRDLKFAVTTSFGPDMEITKDNDSSGTVGAGTEFQWTLQVSNVGDFSAYFRDGQIILRDDLPETNVTYGAPTAGNFVDITNSEYLFCYIEKSIAGQTLYCVAQGGDVIVGAETGSFDVSFSVLPHASGEITNPDGVCQVDPQNRVSEDDETDNDCNSDTVTVTAAVGTPEIDVLGNGVSITNSDNTPLITDNTNFGFAGIITQTITATFTISNTGAGNLILNGSPLIKVAGIHAGDFSVAELPSSTVATDETTTFKIVFNPSALGLRSAAVIIASNDGDENPYTFTIQGTGTADGTVDTYLPLILVQHSATAE